MSSNSARWAQDCVWTILIFCLAHNSFVHAYFCHELAPCSSLADVPHEVAMDEATPQHFFAPSGDGRRRDIAKIARIIASVVVHIQYTRVMGNSLQQQHSTNSCIPLTVPVLPFCRAHFRSDVFPLKMLEAPNTAAAARQGTLRVVLLDVLRTVTLSFLLFCCSAQVRPVSCCFHHARSNACANFHPGPHEQKLIQQITTPSNHTRTTHDSSFHDGEAALPYPSRANRLSTFRNSWAARR